MRTVHLLGVPLELHRRASQHSAALQREFALLAAADPDTLDVPARLVALSEDLSKRYAGLNDDANEELERATARGDLSIDLSFTLPPDAADAADELAALLAEADDYCERGEHLLTLATPPDERRYREWFLTEIANQLRGGPATTWFVAAPLGASPAPSPLKIEGGGRATVRLPEEFDFDEAPNVRVTLLDLLASGIKDLHLDGGSVRFIDSVGISVLMAIYTRCEAAGARVIVDPASDRLRSTLATVGVDDLLLEPAG